MINEIDEMFEYIRLAYEKFINTGNGIRYAVARIFDNIDKFQAIIKEQITEIELQNLLSRIHKIENALTSVQITDNPRY